MTNVLEFLEQSAEKYPNKIAFADEENCCTWQELKEQAQKIGTALTKEVVMGSPVAVWMDKSVDAIITFMGIVYAGCFYVMLDKKQPLQRIAQILDTLEQPLIITNEYSSKETAALREFKEQETGFRILEYQILMQEAIQIEYLSKIHQKFFILK